MEVTRKPTTARKTGEILLNLLHRDPVIPIIMPPAICEMRRGSGEEPNGLKYPYIRKDRAPITPPENISVKYPPRKIAVVINSTLGTGDRR